jgi:threonine dehydratase
LEILEQMAPRVPAAVIVPVGGGGLISGIGAAMEQVNPRPRLIGAQSEASPFFYEIFYHGSQDDAVELESLADGLAGAVEAGSITIPMVQRLASEFVLVSEDAVARAIAAAWNLYHEKIEGSGAVALAAAMESEAARAAGGPVVVVISGGNIQPQVHAQICGYDVESRGETRGQ